MFDKELGKGISEMTKESSQPIYDKKYNSYGNELSREQDEFFRDSKIKDREGNLVVAYHSTNDDFDEFDNKYAGKNGNLFGDGFYFSTNSENIYGYGPKYKEVYLNIKNPYKWNNSYNDTLDILKRYYNNDIDEKLLKEIYNNDFSNDTNIFNYQKKRYGKSDAFTQILKKLGYDGIEILDDPNDIYNRYNEIVAFYPEQIKYIKNMKPTLSKKMTD